MVVGGYRTGGSGAITDDGGMTSGVGSWVERRARSRPESAALVWGDRVWTYETLADRIRRLAHGLASIGVRKGDRVGWIGPNHPAFIESLFATATIGGAMAPANHMLDGARLTEQLVDASPTVIVINGGRPAVALPSSVRAVVTVDAAPGARADVDLETLIADSTNGPIDVDIGQDDVCLIPYTSGTTGPSKGVMLTHGNVTWNVVNLLTCADFRHDDVTLAIAPFFRSGGTGVNVLPVLFKGGTVVIPESGDPDDILGLTERRRATIGFANPDLLDALTRSRLWTTADLSSLRFVMTGGAPVPDRLIRIYQERGLALLQGYGLSEAAPFVLLLDPEVAIHKVGAAGRPPLFVDVRIVRPDGAGVAAGETGELLVRGPNVMAGYRGREEATRAALDTDGWLHTGDAARMDEDGDVWIVDRVRDGFRAGQRFVYPGDIERVILEHPAVADVGVIGLPAPDGGAEAAAFVVAEDGNPVSATDIEAHCAGRLPAEAVPRSITFVARLPRSSVGKLLRHELADLRDAPDERGER
jgi:fatty-acyl-CoA synthase